MPRWIRQVTAVTQQCSPRRTRVAYFQGCYSFRQNGVWDVPGMNDLGVTSGWSRWSGFPGAISGCDSYQFSELIPGGVCLPGRAGGQGQAYKVLMPSRAQVTALCIFEKVLSRLKAKHPGFPGDLSPPPGTQNWRAPLHPPG